MVREQGVIVSIENGVATVGMPARQHAQCKSCGVCRAAEGGRRMLLEADAPEGLHIGDRVTVEIPMPGPGRSAALLLLVPLILFAVGLGVAEALRARGVVSFGSGVSVLIGLALMVAGYVGAGLYDRHLRRSPAHKPRIVSS